MDERRERALLLVNARRELRFLGAEAGPERSA
jgi:hypothetical protein